jgi:hypothetical protein
MSRMADLDTRLQILGHVSIAIDKALRRGTTLAVDAESIRLLGKYPETSMSLGELRDRMTTLAAQHGVMVEPSEPASSLG